VRAHLREYKFWKDSKKGWRSEGVEEMAVVRYSSTSSFGGLGLSEEDCAEDDMGREGSAVGRASDASPPSPLFVFVCLPNPDSHPVPRPAVS
jgi:hypothetical protein